VWSLLVPEPSCSQSHSEWLPTWAVAVTTMTHAASLASKNPNCGQVTQESRRTHRSDRLTDRTCDSEVSNMETVSRMLQCVAVPRCVDKQTVEDTRSHGFCHGVGQRQGSHGTGRRDNGCPGCHVIERQGVAANLVRTSPHSPRPQTIMMDGHGPCAHKSGWLYYRCSW
jgi:hypothetical protein